MAALVLSNIIRLRGKQNRALSVASTICGVVTLFLLNRERGRVDDGGLISAQLTGWFWLTFIASFAIVGSGISLLFARQRAPTQESRQDSRDLQERKRVLHERGRP